jgi:CheY-like chemotaxis protein
MAAGAGALVFTDAALTPGNLDSVLKQLACQPAWSDMPVVLLCQTGAHLPMPTTAWAFRRSCCRRSSISSCRATARSIARAAGFDEHLVKPADLEVLRQKLVPQTIAT